MNTMRTHSAQSSSIIRVGIYRDVETPNIHLDKVINGVDKLISTFGRIAVTETHRLVELTAEKSTKITPTSVNWLETNNHMNFVVTARQIFDSDAQIREGTIATVGMSITRPLRNPFVIIDSAHAPHLMENIVQHEAAHLVRVKDSGKYFDNDGHCNHPTCLMQPIAQKHLSTFCDECSEQLDERLHKLTRHQIPGAEMFRRAVRLLAGDRVATVTPFDPGLEHQWL